MTPLGVAVAYQDAASVQTLIELGADASPPCVALWEVDEKRLVPAPVLWGAIFNPLPIGGLWEACVSTEQIPILSALLNAGALDEKLTIHRGQQMSVFNVLELQLVARGLGEFPDEHRKLHWSLWRQWMAREDGGSACARLPADLLFALARKGVRFAAHPLRAVELAKLHQAEEQDRETRVESRPSSSDGEEPWGAFEAAEEDATSSPSDGEEPGVLHSERKLPKRRTPRHRFRTAKSRGWHSKRRLPAQKRRLSTKRRSAGCARMPEDFTHSPTSLPRSNTVRGGPR